MASSTTKQPCSRKCIKHNQDVVLVCGHHRDLLCVQCVVEKCHSVSPCSYDEVKEEDFERGLFKAKCFHLQEVINERKQQRVEFCCLYDSLKDDLISKISEEEELIIQKVQVMREVAITKVCEDIEGKKGRLQSEIKSLEGLENTLKGLVDENDSDCNKSPNAFNDTKTKLEDITKKTNEIKERVTKPHGNFNLHTSFQKLKLHGNNFGHVVYSDEVSYGSVEDTFDKDKCLETSTENDSNTVPANASITREEVPSSKSEEDERLMSEKSLERNSKPKGFFGIFGRKKPKEYPVTTFEKKEVKKESVYDFVTGPLPKPTKNANLTIQGISTKLGPQHSFVKIQSLGNGRIVILDDNQQSIIMTQYEGLVLDEKTFKEQLCGMCVMSSGLVAVICKDKNQTFILVLDTTSDRIIKDQIIPLPKTLDKVTGFDFNKTVDVFVISTPLEYHNVNYCDNNNVTTTSYRRGTASGNTMALHVFTETGTDRIYTLYQEKKVLECFSLIKGKTIWKRDLKADVTHSCGLSFSQEFLFIPCKNEISVINVSDGRLENTVSVEGDNMYVGIDNVESVLLVTQFSMDATLSKTVCVKEFAIYPTFMIPPEKGIKEMKENTKI